MLPFHLCPAGLGSPPTRRDWLRLGIPLAGVANPFRSPSAIAKPLESSAVSAARAKSVLVIFTGGGMSQLDTWDPKPQAPEEVRGEFTSIATRVPGVRYCEHLPRLAALADRTTLIRSLTHDDLDHGSACYLALTGQFHPRKSSNPPPQPSDFPALGAVLQRVRPSNWLPHAAFQVNGPLLVPREPSPGQFGGILGRGYDPIELGDATQGTALLEGLRYPPEVDPARSRARRQLAAELDRQGIRPGSDAVSTAQQARIEQAYELIEQARIRQAFDLDREPATIRDRYGRYRGGQACLLARRLVEVGVPWITVFFNHNIRGQDVAGADLEEFGWDTHNDIFDDLRDRLLPRFDQSVSALLEDLDRRGLLQQTLVICLGEFGRAPRVTIERNFSSRGAPGRKHWAACYSALAAGAGVPRGAATHPPRQII